MKNLYISKTPANDNATTASCHQKRPEGTPLDYYILQAQTPEDLSNTVREWMDLYGYIPFAPPLPLPNLLTGSTSWIQAMIKIR